MDVVDWLQGFSRDVLQALFHLALYVGESLSKVVLECAFGFVLEFCERAILHVSQYQKGKEHAD